MTKFLIALEIVCLAFIGYLAFAALSWEGHENWAALGLFLYGGPVFLVQLVLMALALVTTARAKVESEVKSVYRRWAVLPPAIALLLFVITLVSEIPA